MTGMPLTVLICTCNRHTLLSGALASLLACDPGPDRVVVVNGGDERADAVVEAARHGGLPVQLVKTQNVNLAVSRNIGLPHCGSGIIAMTDDDAEVFPDWIGQIRQCLAGHPEAGAVGGAVIGTSEHTVVGRVADLTTFPSYPDVCSVRTLPGVNIAYRAEALAAAGEYDPHLARGEDVDVNWRVTLAGYSIVYDPAIKVYHHHRPCARSLLQQHYMYGRAYYRVRRKWPDMYSVFPHSLSRLSDAKKLAWFLAAPLILPLAQAARLRLYGLPALPLVYGRELAWRWGIVRQAWLDRSREASP